MSLHALSTSQGGGVTSHAGSTTHTYLKAPLWKQQEKGKEKHQKKQAETCSLLS